MPDGAGFIERMGLRAVLELKEFQAGVAQYRRLTKQVEQSTQEVVQQTAAATQNMEDQWASYWKSTEKATLGVAKASEESAERVSKSFEKMAKKVLIAIAAFRAVQKAARFLRDATLLAANVEMLGVALETVGKNAGYTAAETRKFEESVKAQGITTQKARQSLLFMGQAQIDFAHAADLARIAQDAGRIANVNSSEAMQRLTWVISTGSTLMARRLGLQVNFEASYKRMAVEVGRSTEELTGQERALARTFEVMRAGEAIAGTYEASLGTAGGLMLSLARHAEEVARAIGEINLRGFAAGIDELTRLLEDLRKWMEENEEALEALGVGVGQLVTALIEFAEMDIPVEELTEFVDQLTTMLSMMAIGLETIREFREENNLLSMSLNRTLTVLGALNKFAAWPITVVDAVIDKFTELRKANEDLFKTETQLREEYLLRYKDDNKDWWKTVRDRWDGIREEEAAAEAARLAALEEMREKAAEVLQDYFDRIEDLQRSYYEKLASMAADADRRRIRAFNKFQVAYQKQQRKGYAALEKILRNYEKKRAKAIKDAAKRISKIREKVAKGRDKTRVDYELRERQARERFDLSMLQSERRYQSQRAWLVAEGDTLAIERLDELYKIQQEEARENEALRHKHAGESQVEQIREAGEAARAQIRELEDQLAEQLAEMEAAYREQIEEQKQANIARLVEMVLLYQEQQRLKDEDDVLARQKAEANYRRKLEDLGRHMKDEEDLQELGAEQVERILEQFYGEDGISDRIMEGWHDRENTRILITSALLAGMATSMSGGGTTLLPGGIPRPGQAVGMQMGGILEGPAMAYIEPGVREAFIPLSGPGAAGGGGGAFTHEFLNALDVTGLEGASQTDVSALAKALAESLTRKVRTRRRG